MEHITVFRDESIYASHASVCLARNGDVLVAFRQAPLEQIFAHVHPESTVGLVRSTDGGRTFDRSTWATVLNPGPEVNLNDPSITCLKDGTLILTVFVVPCPREGNQGKWGDRAVSVRGNDYYFVPSERKIVITRSFDNGITWEEPFDVDTSCYGVGGAGVFAEVVELSDGTILMPITKNDHENDTHRAVLIASRDKGKTWGPFSVMTEWKNGEEDLRCFGLPSAIAYDDLHMLAAGWAPGPGGTTITETRDGGKTWADPRGVDTRGACMHLCLTKSGATIMSYGFRNPPYGIHVLPSYDQGKTWDMNQAAALRSDGAMRDIGYPWTIQLADGRLFCAYYFNVREKDKPYFDPQLSAELMAKWNLSGENYTYETAGLRFIAATIFTEDEMKSLAGTALAAHGAMDAGPTLC